MGFIADAVNAATTAPGTNAAKNQGKRNSNIASTYSDLFGNEAGQYAQWQGVKDLYHPGQILSAALNAMNQTPGQRTQQFAAGANERANAQAMQGANFLKSQGYADGLVGGAAQGAFQNAATQTNAYAAQQMGPDEQLKRILAFLQSIQAGDATFGGALGSLAQGVYGQPQTQVGTNPLLGILGQAAGMYAGAATGGASTLASGGGGAGSGYLGGSRPGSYYRPATGG